MPRALPVGLHGKPCPVCKEASWRELEPDGDASFRLFRCHRCACLRIECERPPAALLYSGYYSGRHTERLSGIAQRALCWLQRRRAGRILRFAPPSARVCDVGCERGELLNVLTRHGCQVVGTQSSRQAAEFAQRQFGIPVFIGELWDAPFAREAFDVVLMLNVLEHLPDPGAYLAQIRRMLRTGGTLWVEVPNTGSFTAWLCGKRWLHHDPAHHFWGFSTSNLAALLRRYGFTIERTAHASWAYGPIGCLQSWLNFLPGMRNVVFQVVREGLSRQPARRAVQLVQLALSACLLPAASLVALLESALGNGQVVLVQARAGKP